MKMQKNSFIILIFSLLLFTSCQNRRLTKSPFKKKIQDYSLINQGTILSGEIGEGKTFYLVRDDAEKMKGFCFIDNKQAVVEVIEFATDSIGRATFVYEGNVYSGKMFANEMEIETVLPEISKLNLKQQTISLKHFNDITKEIDCQEYYKTDVFENITSRKDIQYGKAMGYYSSKPIDHISKDDYTKLLGELFRTSIANTGFLIKYNLEQIPLHLDIYRPETANLGKCPLILFIHGGAFFFGDKENKLQQALTDYFVKKGYIVASINYRMGTSLLPSSIKRTIYSEVQDTRAALNYLVHHKEQFGIDAEQIYLTGSSAGGFISLTTAFMDSNEIYAEAKRIPLLRDDLGGLDDTSDFKEDFKIAGVVSLWGGVTDLEMLNNNIPTLLFHGTKDDIVPSGKGLPFKNLMGNFLYRPLSFCFGEIYGSEPIYKHLQSQNIPVKYYPFPDGEHELHIDSDDSLNENMDIICEEMNNFLYDNVSKHYFDFDLSGDKIVEKFYPAPIYKLNNISENSAVQWQVDGGFITNQTNNGIRVVWYNTREKGTITACITNTNGASCKRVLEVRINR